MHRRVTHPARQMLQLAGSRILSLKFIVSRQVVLAAGVLTCLAFATAVNSQAVALGSGKPTAAQMSAARAAADRASRSTQRAVADQSTLPLHPRATAEASPSATPPAAAADTAAPAPAAPTWATAAPATPAAHARTGAKPTRAAAPAPPTPVAGLTQIQMNHAQEIVTAGKELRLPKRAYVLAVACSLQESLLLNLASTALPESYYYPNDGSGSDYDSVGLFQQRTSTGWGSVQDLMTPDYAAKAFYLKLIQIPGWDTMDLTYAVQAVQSSAFPDAYAQHEARAQTIVDALT
jgi:hypothetical protein